MREGFETAVMCAYARHCAVVQPVICEHFTVLAPILYVYFNRCVRVLSRVNGERDTHRQKSMAAVNEIQGRRTPRTNRLREHPFGRSTFRW